jgi:hypothetical protein
LNSSDEEDDLIQGSTVFIKQEGPVGGNKVGHKDITEDALIL